MTEYTVSVVICTHNRADLLHKSLESVCQQTLAPNKCEIIIVNNGGTDNTKAVVDAYQQAYPAHTIRYIYESRLGLGYARNRGWQEAACELVAYLDDDAIASKDWLSTSVQLFTEETAELICVGGPIDVFYNSEKPLWFKDEYELRSLGTETRFLKNQESFNGSNMIWRKTFIEKYGGFDVDKGVQGNIISVGEETTLFQRIWRFHENPKFLYTPDLKVRHLVAPVKFKMGYRFRRAFVGGQVLASENIRQFNWSSIQRGKIALRYTFKVIKASLFAFRYIFQHRYWQTWVHESFLPVFIDLGYVFAMLGIYITIRNN